ncbi:MAG TPA: type II toxin-antitoxin system prevent-host-death family antitoxin [Verrucomicrobiae bacterium]|nr:type II toxin-antitoxin system prevent-host-death family antitoxin [Verrucomicrobiae bacterium]
MKVKQIGTLEAKTRFSELLAQVEKGHRFRITRHGKPIADLTPVPEENKKRKAGFAPGLITYMAPDFDAPLEDFKEYME